jgi:hypothetical protein
VPAPEVEQRLLDDLGERWMDVENAGGDLVDGVPEAHRLDERLDEERGLRADDVGPLERRRLARLVRADLWGPGRFSSALRTAAVQGKVRRTGRGLHALAPGAPGPDDDSPPADHAPTATEPAAP